MYNTEKLIAEGQEIMKQNPRRMLGTYQMVSQKEQSEDIYQFGTDMFLMGLAIGARINKNSDLAEG
jgi:hypothetical protein